jgi:hypothetical protein
VQQKHISDVGGSRAQTGSSEYIPQLWCTTGAETGRRKSSQQCVGLALPFSHCFYQRTVFLRHTGISHRQCTSSTSNHTIPGPISPSISSTAPRNAQSRPLMTYNSPSRSFHSSICLSYSSLVPSEHIDMVSSPLCSSLLDIHIPSTSLSCSKRPTRSPQALSSSV